MVPVRGCDPIAAPAFGRAHAGRLLLHYHDERSGTFALLRLVPDEKVVVLPGHDQDLAGRAAGAMTQAEFDAQKQKILGA